MRRNVVFDKGRGWRGDDRPPARMHIREDRGADVGEYRHQETSEFSDAYYGPGDDYARRDFVSGGYSREQQPIARSQLQPGPPVGRFAPQRHPDNRIYGEVRSYGELHAGERSWADLKSHRGRGPKGYARSDERLTELICERLTDDPHIDASDIAVEVKQGKVTLSGTVHDKLTRWRVEDAVEAIGVEEVSNRLRVAAPGER
ncbi:BON domain-containing protein [Peristeroidobacter agariperforans]|uniref:BON domain-containing protein n=1 Tax=Peristeroidobacter agariperforans TaxID=268404 RepID=UPI00101C435D|nr:BON domain-containing protein [Peristeroidobacter agariperforans]